VTLLDVSNLDAYYDRSQALSDVSLAVDAGEIVGVIGPNGAGKTTLLNVLSGLKDYEGSATYDGAEIADLPPTDVVERGLIQCSERRDLYSYMSVEKNLEMGAYARGHDDLAANRERVYDLFPRLEERREQDAETMSGGEQQMLAIGRSLVSDPRVLMLDEPTLGLAPVVIEQISETLETLAAEGMTVLLAEQNATFALGHAERLYLLETGRIELSGDAAEFRENEHIRDAYVGIA